MDTMTLHFQFPLSLRHVIYRRIMTGSISLSDVTELKCTNLEDYLSCINPMKTNANPNCTWRQFGPRSKHIPFRLRKPIRSKGI